MTITRSEIEEELTAEMAKTIQEELDADIIWHLIERENWPYDYYIELRPMDLAWVSQTFKVEDFIYRNGTIYFKQEKHLTWMKLKYPGSQPLRRA
jgi:uncharacterized protein YjcR